MAIPFRKKFQIRADLSITQLAENLRAVMCIMLHFILCVIPGAMMSALFTLTIYWQILDELDRRYVLKTLKTEQQRMSMRKSL